MGKYPKAGVSRTVEALYQGEEVGGALVAGQSKVAGSVEKAKLAARLSRSS
jgi:hypothetical protein